MAPAVYAASALARRLSGAGVGTTARVGAAAVVAANARVLSSDSADSAAEEFIERNLRQAEETFGSRPNVLTTRREAIMLYRDILRAARFFTWKNERGETYRDVLTASARAEFESARFESDPVIVTKLIVTGREALDKALAAFIEKARAGARGGEDRPR